MACARRRNIRTHNMGKHKNTRATLTTDPPLLLGGIEVPRYPRKVLDPQYPARQLPRTLFGHNVTLRKWNSMPPIWTKTSRSTLSVKMGPGAASHSLQIGVFHNFHICYFANVLKLLCLSCVGFFKARESFWALQRPWWSLLGARWVRCKETFYNISNIFEQPLFLTFWDLFLTPLWKNWQRMSNLVAMDNHGKLT